MYLKRFTKTCVITAALLVLITLPALAWDWPTPPEPEPISADLVGEVLEVGQSGLTILSTQGGKVKLAVASNCEITLNGVAVSLEALAPISASDFVEARIQMAHGEAVRIQGVYCTFEAHLVELGLGRVKLLLTNSGGESVWVNLADDSLSQGMRVGEDYLVLLDSTGRVKNYHHLSPIGGEMLLLANIS